MKKLLIITSITNESRSTQRETLKLFADRMNESSSKVHLSYCSVQELVFSLKNGICSISWNGTELKQVIDVIHIRNADKFTDYANALRMYCEVNNLSLINTQDNCFPFSGKLSQGFLFAINNIPTPDLISSHSNKTLLEHIKAMNLKYPFILKQNDGMKGLHNYLVPNQARMIEILNTETEGFVMQPFIENHGELRILTFGTEGNALVFKKTARKGSYLNNTSRGGTVERLKPQNIPGEIFANALKAATFTNLDFGGVDVLLGKDGRWYILEVNRTPALASGALKEDKLRLYEEYIGSIGVQE